MGYLKLYFEGTVAQKGACPKQHWMLVGPRGIGKSHLLSLLYYKITNDEKLRNLWIPVLFPEELRMAGNLSKFLERAAREICQDLEKTNDSLAAELKSRIDGIKKVRADERTEYLFSVLTLAPQIHRTIYPAHHGKPSAVIGQANQHYRAKEASGIFANGRGSPSHRLRHNSV